MGLTDILFTEVKSEDFLLVTEVTSSESHCLQANNFGTKKKTKKLINVI